MITSVSASSNPVWSLCKTLSLTQPIKSLAGYVILVRSCDHNINIFQPIVIQCLGCERVILSVGPYPPVVYPSPHWARINAVLTADTVATGEVNY